MEKSLKKRRKGIEGIFNIMFLGYLFEIAGYLLFKILYITGVATVDIFNLTEFIVLLIGLGFMFLSARLAHNGHIAAGIIGIIVALVQILCGRFIIGLIIVICSIMYLVNYNKKN